MTSTNWIQIAEARGIPSPIHPERFLATLDALESTLHPLVAGLSFETEPAVILSEQSVLGK